MGAHKGSERVPVQFLSRLSLSEPTGGVPEVWDHKLSSLYKDNQKGLNLFIDILYTTIRFLYSGTDFNY